MRKLRLFKPWALRTVRQRLYDFPGSSFHPFLLHNCSGPASGHNDHPINRLAGADLRNGNIKLHEYHIHSAKAPVIEVISFIAAR
jgi:hypothetical protein